MPHHVLIIENPSSLTNIEKLLLEQERGYNTTAIRKHSEALSVLQSPKALSFDLIVLNLEPLEMMEVLTTVSTHHPHLSSIVLVSDGDITTVVNAIKAGANEVIENGEMTDFLPKQIEQLLTSESEVAITTEPKNTREHDVGFANILGESQAIKECITIAERSAKSSIPVFLNGESGVGKELFARAIHNSGERKDKPFIAVNCGAIPENLVESTLFGHEKGSFTGAIGKNIGKFREADGGTLFLDEVGELKPDVQIKLLRILQEGEVEPVGAKRPEKVDVRIISATNRNLEEEVQAGRFRQDLYYRLYIFPITIPPLRHRKEDISTLLTHFYRAFASTEHKPIQGIDEKVEAQLVKYDWPGNVRELKNAVYRAVVISHYPILNEEDFSHILTHTGKTSSDDGYTADPQYAAFRDQTTGHFKKMFDIEEDAIRAAIAFYNGHISEIARRLGIGRSTLYRKMEALGIDPSSNETDAA